MSAVPQASARAEQLHGPLWPRFDAYVLEAGLIKPAPGAKIEWYDPWAEDVQRKAQAEEDRAYKSLDRLVQQIFAKHVVTNARTKGVSAAVAGRQVDPLAAPGLTALGRKEEKQLLAWCRHNGLLGLLHHQIVQVMLPPVWRDMRPEDGSLGKLFGPKPIRAMQPVLQHGALGWTTQWRWCETRTNDDTLIGLPVARKAWGNDVVAPEATYRLIDGPHYETEPLPGRWQRYFPGRTVEETAARLGEEDVWRSYCEPLDDFVTTVRLATYWLSMLQQVRTMAAQDGNFA
ncbi:MAG: hypothetical protein ACLQUT_11570, partial [Thermoleophilia bacterium]